MDMSIVLPSPLEDAAVPVAFGVVASSDAPAGSQ
jgi:hypothetical protein